MTMADTATFSPSRRFVLGAVSFGAAGFAVGCDLRKADPGARPRGPNKPRPLVRIGSGNPVTRLPRHPPAPPGLLIVCLLGLALGGVNLTAVYRPAFYAFVLPAVVPLIVRVAAGGDGVHHAIAAVMTGVRAETLSSISDLTLDSSRKMADRRTKG